LEGEVIKRYTYAAYPAKQQETLLKKTFGSTRFVYNHYVQKAKSTGNYVDHVQACKDLVLLKEEHEWLKDVSDRALQQSLKDATQAVRNHMKNPKHFGLPKFKKLNSRQAFRITGKTSFRVNKLNAKWSEVYLPKMGPLKFRTERPLPNKPKSVSVIFNADGSYQVSFTVEIEAVSLSPLSKVLAVDLGLKYYLTTIDTNGNIQTITNPRFYRQAQLKLTKLQSKYSAKKKGTKNQNKARLRLAKQHMKIANQRKDFIRQLVHRIVSENQAIITESLAIANMAKNHSLSKSIMDASWGMFLDSLNAKCIETGRSHIKIDRFFPSSKTCSNCGVINDTLNLSQREWTCTHCHVKHDRDVNAARNMLIAGIENSLLEEQRI
jgi:putative transposase